MQSLSFILLLFLVNVITGYLLPHPPGKHNVTLTTGPLIDYTRNDPTVDTPRSRTLMLSIFQLAACASTVSVPYMPPKTAKFQGPFLQTIFNITADFSPLLLEARLPVCPADASDCSNKEEEEEEDYPILLFSPGYSIPRLFYNVLASAIASQGFNVITFDSPGDANIITYPDGHAVYNNDTTQTLAAIREQVQPVAGDATFVIDQLRNATAIASLLPRRGRKPFRTDRIAMLGHSLGGVASVIAASQDPRIRAAINIDGTFIEMPLAPGVSQPVLLMSHGMGDASWRATWPLLKGPKLWVDVANTTHQTFSDSPTLLEASGQDAGALEGLLGTIGAAQVMRIMVAHVTAWMDGVFNGEPGVLEAGEFPEVSVVKERNL